MLGVRQLHAGAERDLHEVRYVWKYDRVFVTSYTHASQRSQYSNAAGGANFIGPMTVNHEVEGSSPSALTNDRNDEFRGFRP